MSVLQITRTATPRILKSLLYFVENLLNAQESEENKQGRILTDEHISVLIVNLEPLVSQPVR